MPGALAEPSASFPLKNDSGDKDPFEIKVCFPLQSGYFARVRFNALSGLVDLQVKFSSMMILKPDGREQSGSSSGFYK